ncbi:protein of unknown function [Nitrosomonas sp. PY1]|uniref:DUF3570 domain-containing protein n=1 Tax=Nitrosomonas sp. PY1 TaxID=1803906 RepID=UPI001FC89707|nr:DUF3570 domain-containing protein [Nitrosomonas sp. PY1]GKS69068.1 protein of unknown function [Nitrosomonas sp. PY1]
MQQRTHKISFPLVNKDCSQALSSALHALTSAALVLPGLLTSSPALTAPGDRINFQYGRYEEGYRNLYGVPNPYKSISVDVLHGNGVFSLTDRTKFSFSYTQDTWAGATPITTTPLATDGGNRPIIVNQVVVGASPLINSNILLDRNLDPIGRNPITKQLTDTVDTRSVHVMSSASPETRHQAIFGLSHEWNEAAINVSGGFSRERDYKSTFGSIGGRLDFNQKLTTVKFTGSYTSSDIGAILDHDALPYITKTAYQDQIIRKGGASGSEVLLGDRHDWYANLGITQILSKNSLLDASIGYTNSNGFMENPYKVMSVIFVDPNDLNNPQTEFINGQVRALIEQRPNIRNQVALNTKYIHHISPFNAALHLGYRLSVDDWGINTHTFDGSWVQPLGNNWTLTPRIRYYSQDAANFYHDYLFSRQAFSKPLMDTQGRQVYVDRDNPNVQYFSSDGFSFVDQNGNFVDDAIAQNAQPQYVTYDASLLPKNFSSDHRLAGFGALSGGVTLTKRLWKGVDLEAGFEYYTRASSMEIGGGSTSFANFDYYVANAAIKLDMERTDAPGSPFASSHSSHNGSHASEHLFHKIPPAGIMFGHMLDQKGDFMVGYRFMLNKTNGQMHHGTHAVIDQTIIDQGCSDIPCRFTPTHMNMYMHMLDIMYAPTKWLNVMLMPTFMTMDMNLRNLFKLDGTTPPEPPGSHSHSGIAGHETGAIGDVYFSALVKLFQIPGHRAHINIGFSAPTGKVDIEQRRSHRVDPGLIHFGMQLGSGTWDFMPSLTYTGERKRLSWGTQISGTKRMEDNNKSGYRLGDIFQASTWGGIDLVPWLTASVRGIYTWQDAIRHDFDVPSSHIGPMDYPQNYGGQFWDIGFGLNATIPQGRFAGNRFGFEWIQPVRNDFNGFQLDRKGSLAATWSYHF